MERHIFRWADSRTSFHETYILQSVQLLRYFKKRKHCNIEGWKRRTSKSLKNTSRPLQFRELKKLINGLFEAHYNKLEAQINTPEAVLEIKNFRSKTITINRNFANIFGIDISLELITNVKSLRYPTSYFIHCDLIDRNFNFVNNKKSDLLAKIDVSGKAHEKVRYDASAQQPIRDCSTSSHVNSITISVRDQDGELFDFKDFPLEFELELN